MKLFDWLRPRLAARAATRRVRALERRCDALERDRRRAEDRLESAAQAAAAAYSRLQGRLEDAQATVQQQADLIQGLRSTAKNQEIEIEQLAAAHTRNLERYRAETAVEVQRQIAAAPDRSDFGVR